MMMVTSRLMDNHNNDDNNNKKSDKNNYTTDTCSYYRNPNFGVRYFYDVPVDISMHIIQGLFP